MDCFVGEESDWVGRRMVLDGVALEQLSIVPLDYAPDEAASSLYNILNKCKTSFGARLLRSWICAPTCDRKVVRERQAAITWLRGSSGREAAEKAKSVLEKLPDLERILQRIHSAGLVYRARHHPDSRAVMFEAEKYGRTKIREFTSAIQAFRLCQTIGSILQAYIGTHEERNPLLDARKFEVQEHVRNFEEAFDAAAAVEIGRIEPRYGCDPAFDAAGENVKACEKHLEKYRSSTAGRLGCKITFHGTGRSRYQLEIPDNSRVPPSFEAKSKRKGFTRYSCPELEDLVRELDSAEKEREAIVKDATRKIFADFDSRKSDWRRVVEAAATLDVLCSLAAYADCTGVNMVLPEFVYENTQPLLEIEKGYHPCIVVTGLPDFEELTSGAPATSFIPNDICLGGDDNPKCLLLSGPNMGGKSTFMRQVALLTVLAHIGSLVPARRMRLSPVDRIFTRIGACDRLVAGESTFFVEMNESNVALRNGTKHSIAIFDELGRGTGSLDGQAIAWAILNELCRGVGARSIFSTHYHPLCKRVKNDKDIMLKHMGYLVEKGEAEKDSCPMPDSITFRYRLEDGACPQSFGFHAALMAGINPNVTFVIVESWKVAREVFGDPKESSSGQRKGEDDSVTIEALREQFNEELGSNIMEE